MADWSRRGDSGWRGRGEGSNTRSAERDDSGGRDGGVDDAWRSRGDGGSEAGRGGWREHRMGEGGMSPDEMRRHGEMMRRMMQGGGMGGMGMGGMGGMGRGARFMLRAGDVRLAVQCSAGEPMKACVDAATSLMDRAKTMSPSGSGSGGGSSSGSGAQTPATPTPGAMEPKP